MPANPFKRGGIYLAVSVLPRVEDVVLESAACLAQDGTRLETVRRSWRERLLSWPWRPWVATKTVEVAIMVPCAYVLKNGKVIAHPDLAKLLRKR